MTLAHADTPQTATIALHVVNVNGAPRAGLCVWADTPDEPNTSLANPVQTDSTGAATVTTAIRPGDDLARVVLVGQCDTTAKTGAAATWAGGTETKGSAKTFTVAAGKKTSAGTVLVPDYGTVSGTLKDDLGRTYLQTCIELADDEAPQSNGGSTQTSNRGPFTYPDHLGNWTMTGVYPGHAHRPRYFDCRDANKLGGVVQLPGYPTSTPDQETDSRFTVRPGQAVTGVKLTLPAGGKINGQVVDQAAQGVNDPQLCVELKIHDPSYPQYYLGFDHATPLNADGTFSVTRVIAGTYDLTVLHCGDGNAAHNPGATETVTVANDQTTYPPALVAPATASAA